MGRTSGLCSPGLPSRGHSRQQASSRTPDPFFLQICEAEPQPQTHYPESAWATAPPPFAKVLGPEAAARVPRQARRPTPMPRTLRRVLESHTPDGGRRMSLRRTPLWVFPRPLGTHPKPTFAPVDGGPTPTPRAAGRGPAPSPQPSAPTAQVAAPHAPRRCGPQRSRPPETLPTPSAPSLPPPSFPPRFSLRSPPLSSRPVTVPQPARAVPLEPPARSHLAAGREGRAQRQPHRRREPRNKRAAMAGTTAEGGGATHAPLRDPGAGGGRLGSPRDRPAGSCPAKSVPRAFESSKSDDSFDLRSPPPSGRAGGWSVSGTATLLSGGAANRVVSERDSGLALSLFPSTYQIRLGN